MFNAIVILYVIIVVYHCSFMGNVRYDNDTHSVHALVRAVPPPAGDFVGWPCQGFNDNELRGHFGVIHCNTGDFQVLGTVGL